MELRNIIKELKKHNKDKVCEFGFKDPHSYRGRYHELSFQPAENITVGEMIECATSAIGSAYTGWKGGEYIMSGYTNCNIAYIGECGEVLGDMTLKLILGDNSII